MALFSMRAIQGEATASTVTLSISTFVGDEALTAPVNTGGTAAAVLTLTPTWTAGQTANAYGMVDVALTSVQSAALEPDFYVVAVSLAAGGACLAYGLLEIISAAGQSPTQDWLVTPARVLGLVPDIEADLTSLADLPRAISAASDAVRRYCNRWFTRRTMTKEFPIAQDWSIRLDEVPVNAVARVATDRATVLTITGSPSAFQIARVSFTMTGDRDSGQVVTGMTLTSVSSAVTTTTPLLFATYTTIQALADAINAVSGWTATVASGYGSWPTSELVGTAMAQGVLTDGAEVQAYTSDAALSRVDQDTGFCWLGQGGGTSSLNTPAWGPDWSYWAYQARLKPNRALVTYDAGYDVVPESVVMATVQTVQSIFNRLATDQIIKSESAADYSYTLRDPAGFIPQDARAALSLYRIHNA